MHELSIAMAILDRLPRLAPPGAVLRAIDVEAGPLRAIDPEALAFAWQCATADGPWNGVKLNLICHPYRLKCPACGTTYDAPDPYTQCACGAGPGQVMGGDELRVVSIEVDDLPTGNTDESHPD